MELSAQLYLALLGVVGAGRLFELRLSKLNQRRMAERGARRVEEPGYPWMVALHASLLLGAAAEVAFLERPLIPWLGAAASTAWVLANVMRWWVIRTLALHWNVQVVASTPLGIVTGGPYRWVRHPNYTAVFVEMLALPLIHTAWATAAIGTLFHVWVLAARVTLEERVLSADPAYRAAMGAKPRFLPRLRSREAR
jgi:methyltransferase